MPVTLDRPISWKIAVGGGGGNTDDGAMLASLQPNILKGHTREFLTLLFLKFNDGEQARLLLKELSGDGIVPAVMKSAAVHFAEVAAFKDDGTKGAPYVGVGLSNRGYEALGIAEDNRPPDPSFRRGMTHNETIAKLVDPDVDDWEGHFGQLVDAVILIGDQLRGPRDAMLDRVRTMIAARPQILIMREQSGNGLHNRNGDGIEHFGYVDGRSQPLFLTEDIEDETLRSDGTTNWDPGFALSRAIVPDVAAPDPAIHFGSYFVFRKLEQNVQLFKFEEKELAKRLGLTCEEEERAGAMLVGRFEDGTPLASQSAEGMVNPVPNDFTYDSDTDGGKCPFFAHIRKVNPRGSGGFESHEDERLHIMARRGQTYGVRTDDPNDGKLDNKPTDGVGLLFMAFNADLGEQFEFAQSLWANNTGFPAVPAGTHAPGLDLIIGHGHRPPIDAPLRWGADPFAVPRQYQTTDAVPQTVTMKGGEYFFMPSLAFLQAL